MSEALLAKRKAQDGPALIEPEADEIYSRRLIKTRAVDSANKLLETGAVASLAHRNGLSHDLPLQTISDASTGGGIEVSRLNGQVLACPAVIAEDCVSDESRDLAGATVHSQDGSVSATFSAARAVLTPPRFVLVPRAPRQLPICYDALPAGRPLPAPPVLRSFCAKSNFQASGNCP